MAIETYHQVIASRTLVGTSTFQIGAFTSSDRGPVEAAIENDKKRRRRRISRSRYVTTSLYGAIGYNERARRRSPDLAETADRRSPHTTNLRSEVCAGSGDPRTAEPHALALGAGLPTSPKVPTSPGANPRRSD